jgi:hypothetical protein
MSIEATDDRAAANAKGPRVALKDIEAEITSVYYTTGDKFMTHAVKHDNKGKGHNPHTIEASALTICLVHMKNGYFVVGRAAPAYPENFKAELGQRLAYEDAVRQIWPILGYMLKEQLHTMR